MGYQRKKKIQIEKYPIPFVHRKRACSEIMLIKSFGEGRSSKTPILGQSIYSRESEPKEPFSMCKISQSTFLRHNEAFHGAVVYENGIAKYWEPPGGHIIASAVSELQFFFHKLFMGYLLRTGNFVCGITPKKIRMPHLSFLPWRRRGMHNIDDETNFPTLILEVSHLGQSVTILKETLLEFLSESTDIQIAIGIKVQIFPGKKIRLIFLMTTREREDFEEIEIGTVDGYGNPLSRRGLPTLSLPFCLLFHSAPIPPLTGRNEFRLKLKVISKEIVTCIQWCLRYERS